MQNITIIGAGVAGIGTALELADRGHKVTLLDKNTLGYGASSRNPGRMGLGFHYVDFDTAKMYLSASIKVQRKFPDFLVAAELEKNHPFRRGRYFITKDSDYTPDEILNTYQKLKEEYIRLIQEDPENEVFGPPESFFNILKPEDYINEINSERIAVGVETAEHLFNWKKFSEHIKHILLNHPNISFLEQTEVTQIQHNKNNESRYLLSLKQSKDEHIVSYDLKTDYVINSTWENIEHLNSQINCIMTPDFRTNRLKCLLLVKLPESLLESNSMFFCMGQHCMYSNLGNGYGMMTYAKVTNMETSTGLTLSENTKRLLRNEATQEEKKYIAEEMIQGVSKYIPAMKDAQWIDVRYGIVQTAGKTTIEDLKDPNNMFHRRDYDNIRTEKLGFISNPCVKLFYFVRNGEKIADLLEEQFETSLLLDKILEDMDSHLSNVTKLSLNSPQLNEIKSSIKDHLERTVLTKPFETITKFKDSLFKTIKNKNELLASLDEQTKNSSKKL